ncbi:MAG: LysM domain-containing protein [Bacteroidales bacterium]
MENNNVEYIIVQEGDTYESLADRHQLLSWEITRYNDLTQGAPLVPGQVIYLQPKRTKAAQGLSMHTVEAGETMYSISQKYAVKLSSLYKMNLMDEGTECRPGQKLRIR